MPKINVSVVSGNAGTLKVTGSNFAKNATVHVQFAQNGFLGENLAQDFTTTSNGSGKISLTAAAYVSAACLVGVSAWDANRSATPVNLNTTGKGCAGAKLQVDPCRPVCTDFYTTGTGFTPEATIDVFYEFTDNRTNQTTTFSARATGCGTLRPGRYPPAPAGQLQAFGACNGFTEHSDSFCHTSVVKVWAEEDLTDYVTPALFVDPRCHRA
jgi:hypothetical protein